MNASELTHPIESLRTARTAGWRVRTVAALGPLTLLAGVVWAILQPYRVTLLHPHGQGFYWLVAEPPLFVVVVGLIFHFVIAPGLVRDLEAVAGEEEEG